MRLTPVGFTEGDFARVQDFHCGDLPHQLPLATWIKKTAIEHLRKKTRTRTWLYELPDRIDVGYGALNLEWLKGDPMEWGGEEKVKIQVIETMAVRTNHKGNGYSHEIVDHLEREATKRLKTLPSNAKLILGLYVNSKNVEGVSLYKQHGFNDFDHTLPCPHTGDSLRCMIKKLRRT